MVDPVDRTFPSTYSFSLSLFLFLAFFPFLFFSQHRRSLLAWLRYLEDAVCTRKRERPYEENSRRSSRELLARGSPIHVTSFCIIHFKIRRAVTAEDRRRISSSFREHGNRVTVSISMA